MKTNKMATK